MELTKKNIYKCLSTVIDPELNIDIVSIGLIYDVSIGEKQMIHILMTLTTPGCPLAGVIQEMIKDSFSEFDGIDTERNVDIEITFDPPWIADMMTKEAKAELNL